MSDESRAKIQEYLQDEDYRKVLEYCREPRKSTEINALGVDPSKRFDLMRKLWDLKAIQMDKGRYFTSPFVLEMLSQD